jgi:hypothetical protein
MRINSLEKNWPKTPLEFGAIGLSNDVSALPRSILHPESPNCRLPRRKNGANLIASRFRHFPDLHPLHFGRDRQIPFDRFFFVARGKHVGTNRSGLLPREMKVLSHFRDVSVDLSSGLGDCACS